MWEIKGKSIDANRFTPMEPLRVLNYYDGPRIFTFLDADAALCLACWSDEDESGSRFLAVPMNDALVSDLEGGLLTVREALRQPRFWVIDLNREGTPVSAWLLNPDDVPEDAQPQPRTMLHRSLEPLLSLRATGDAIRPGEIPGSVIRGTVDGAQKALKCLAEYEMDLPAHRGHPLRALQKLYDLPAQRLRAASFEVQFRSPLHEPGLFAGLNQSEIDEEKSVLHRVGAHLRTGLDWLTSTKADNTVLPVPNNPELSRVIVKAMKLLTPSPRGPVRELEVSGDMVSRLAGPVRLTRASRSVVNSAIARLPIVRQTIVRLEGSVRELNADTMSFLLRDLDNEADRGRECRFEADLWDNVYDLLGLDARVAVAGTQTSPTSIVQVADLSLL